VNRVSRADHRVGSYPSLIERLGKDVKQGAEHLIRRFNDCRANLSQQTGLAQIEQRTDYIWILRIRDLLRVLI
jgi:hypothetical protein